ncbi:hypothetical protein [Leifsonia poae]|uniref:hypothetical protein n=1 Tax=Leifsonia poae TaxID=110933 RepID=UPI003D665332
MIFKNRKRVERRTSGVAVETLTQLIDVVRRVIELLEQCGRQENAHWMRERLRLLQVGDASETLACTKELHSIVLGMGGLIDISLEPRDPLSLSANDARASMDELADRLYRLTSE